MCIKFMFMFMLMRVRPMYESIINFNSVQMGADVEKNPAATCTLTVQNSNCTILHFHARDIMEDT